MIGDWSFPAVTVISDFAPSSETPDFASSFRLREATSGKQGGYVGGAGSYVGQAGVLGVVPWGDGLLLLRF